MSLIKFRALPALLLCVLAGCAYPAPAQASFGGPDLTKLLNIPVVYEFKPASLGILGRFQTGKISKLGCDIDTLAGLASPTKSLVLGKELANLTGQAGFGASWSWTVPKTSYYFRAGVGVLEIQGSQPSGSVYVMAGIH